ncbi:PilN domain-containing protein [Thiofaba sp. EF100]|uniref:PilN domain-containing protein n=1 Tax=Thiofaba sp. EF100 TaxID=3121274 RepID=UPI00322166C3
MMTAVVKSRGALGAVRQVLHWWGRELRSLLTVPPFSLLFGHDDRVIIDLEAERLALTKCHGGEDTPLGVFPFQGRLDAAALDVLRGQVRRGTEAVIRLPREQLLCRNLSLPLEAEPNLREVLGYEMDRQTPFRADQVYYDYQVLERRDGDRRLVVQMLVAPQASLAPLLHTLEGQGLVPSMITVAEQGAPYCDIAAINLLPASLRRRPAGVWGRVNGALALSALVLLALAAVLPLQRQQVVIEDLEGRLAALAPQVQSAGTMRAAIDEMREELALFVTQKRQSPVAIDVLEEVSRILPDDTWLVRLELHGRRLRLQGFTVEAPALIGLLEASPLLANVTFTSPVVRDPRYGRFQFSIEADVVGGRGG